MNLREAFAYLREHQRSVINPNFEVIGVAYTPDDEVEFYIVNLHLDEAELLKGIDYYCVHLCGGNISSEDGVEDFLGNEDFDNLIDEMPDFAKNINYQVYTLEDSPFGFQSSYALKTIFPNLPDPDNSHHNVFKKEAIALITKLNE